MRWRQCQGLVCCWLALAWASQPAAHAQERGRRTTTTALVLTQDAAAVATPSAGETAYALGDFAGALRAFERAYAQHKEPRTLFRIGDAADKLGMHARAASAFQQYLSLVPTARDRAFIESRWRANRAALGTAADRTLGLPQVAQAPEAPLRAAPRQAPRAQSVVAAPAVFTRNTRNTLERAPAAAPEAAVRVTPPSGESPRIGAWWLWAGAGTVVVAGIVVAALSFGSSVTSPDPVRGNLGSAVQTLARP